MSILKLFFKQKESGSFLEAKRRLDSLSKKLEARRYKEIYITEIHC